MKLNLKSRVIILVLVSFTLFLAVAAKTVYENWEKSRSYHLAVSNLKIAEAISSLVNSIQKERGLSTTYLHGGVEYQEVNNQRQESDQLNNEVRTLLLTSQIPEDAKNQVVEAFEHSVQARRLVDSKEEVSKVSTEYNEVITDFLYTMKSVSGQTEIAEFANNLNSISILEKAKDSAGMLRANLSGVFAKNEPIDNEKIQLILELKASVNAYLHSPALRVSSITKTFVDGFKTNPNWTQMQSYIKTILDNHEYGEYNISAKDSFNASTRLIEEIHRGIKNEFTNTNSKIEAEVKEITFMFWVFIGFLVLASIAPFFLAKWLLNAITKPIQATIERLKNCSSKITHASSNLTSSSGQLSNEFQKTAASLQETVSTMSEMNSMVATTLEKAKETQEASEDVSQRTLAGDSIVMEMVNSMEEIQKANQQLEDIANVIDEISAKTNIINDIVFKTQLLSFNASIEAARAGQHGRGFAVVAEEVGNLAQLSGGAANEIRSLIEESQKRVSSILKNTSERVQQGKEISGKVKNIFGEISAQISSITEQVQVVTEASNEQKLGIEQITTAISEIDDATQTATTEATQTSNLAGELNTESSNLQYITSGLIALVSDGKTRHIQNKQHTNEFNHKKEPSFSNNQLDFSSDKMINQLSNKFKQEKFQEDVDFSADDDSFIDRAG